MKSVFLFFRKTTTTKLKILHILSYTFSTYSTSISLFVTLPFIFFLCHSSETASFSSLCKSPHLIALGAPSYASNSYFSFSKVEGKTLWPSSWETWPLRLPPRTPRKISHHSLCGIVTRAGSRKPPVGWGFSDHFIHLRRRWPGSDVFWWL